VTSTVITTVNTIDLKILDLACYSDCSGLLPSKASSYVFSLIQSMRVEALYKNPRYINEKRPIISKHDPTIFFVFPLKFVIAYCVDYDK